MSGQNGKRPAHRPARYDAGPEGFASFQADTERFLRSMPAELLSMRLWMDFMQISKVTLSNYKQRSAAWREFIEDTRQRIMDRLSFDDLHKEKV